VFKRKVYVSFDREKICLSEHWNKEDERKAKETDYKERNGRMRSVEDLLYSRISDSRHPQEIRLLFALSLPASSLAHSDASRVPCGRALVQPAQFTTIRSSQRLKIHIILANILLAFSSCGPKSKIKDLKIKISCLFSLNNY
jgi:hypothetical protein